ncbi:hypothetical protein NE237_002601 [Protea cynaroides]|uniref:Uncharacterized protein n=1 Tax=Protea cynaroides TaxID=273540 RepID=A0A9Q0KVH1_9MAGN|nr:hypothetical protein NE237_002601 [Protea cynaroides]
MSGTGGEDVDVQMVDIETLDVAEPSMSTAGWSSTSSDNSSTSSSLASSKDEGSTDHESKGDIGEEFSTEGMPKVGTSTQDLTEEMPELVNYEKQLKFCLNYVVKDLDKVERSLDKTNKERDEARSQLHAKEDQVNSMTLGIATLRVEVERLKKCTEDERAAKV